MKPRHWTARRSEGIKSCVLAVLLAMVVSCVLSGRASAQADGVLTGQLLDVLGKPWAEITIEAVSDQGVKVTAKSDKDGNFTFRNLRAGTYTLMVDLPAPNQPYKAAVVAVRGAETPKAILNFKELVGKEGAEAAAQQKKAEEDKTKFQGMKAHFEAGVALLEQVKVKKAEVASAPADQRDAKKQELSDVSAKAVTEFEAAKAAAPEKDPNMQLIYARLADAYDAAGRTDDAIAAYQQAIALKPLAAYYNNLGGIYGRAGKIDEATAAYQKSAELDPAGAAQAWRNFGITLYNAGRLKEAVEPLKKATELDPKSAQAWYLLGASLVGAMETKKVGDKLEFIIQPGTVEAYQKAIELDPNGGPNSYGGQAKQGLEALQQIAPGIDTKVNVKKKKS